MMASLELASAGYTLIARMGVLNTMRIWVIAAVSILVGMGAGFGSVYIEFAKVPDQFEPHNRPAPKGLDGDIPTEIPQAVVVDGRSFDFGKAQRDSKMKHTFVIKNEGSVPLTLEKGPTSCKCALSDLESDSIMPGKSGKVTLEWKINVLGKHFRQTAEVYTNDPVHSTILLEITGKITDMLRMEPRDLVLSSVSVSEGGDTQFRIYGFDIENIEIVEHKFDNQEIAPFFDLTFANLQPADLKSESDASCGVVGTLAVKPGLPLGPINQKIHLKTNIEKASNLELSVTGSVIGDISIVGPRDFSHTASTVRFGTLDSSEGAKTTLRLLVKGPYRRDVDLWVKEIEPADVVVASLGEPKPINDGAVYMYPLTVEIPKNTRSVNCLGVKKGALGKILIETTHPSAKEVPIYVRFAVK